MGGGMNQYSNESPFFAQLEDHALLTGHSLPKFSIYNGRTDPYEHVTQYERQIWPAWHGSITMCQMFEVYLKDGAQVWYHIILPGSIDTYDHLKDFF